MKASWEVFVSRQTIWKKCPSACLTGDDDGHQTEAGEGCERKRKVEPFYFMPVGERWLKIWEKYESVV